MVRPALLEATAFGAFRMCLVGSGVVGDPAQAPALPGTPLVVHGTLPAPAVARLRARWRTAVERARGWA